MWVKTEKGFVNLSLAVEVACLYKGQPQEAWYVYTSGEDRSFPILKEELPKVFAFMEANSL